MKLFRFPMYQHCQRDARKNDEFLEQRIVDLLVI